MLKLSDASVEDVETRLKELKNDFVELSEGRREDVSDDALRAMIREVDVLDTFLTLSAAVERREQTKIAATAGAIATAGFRSLGEAVVTEDLMAKISRELSAGWSDHITADGRHTQRQHVATMNFENTDGKRDGTEITNWLQLAGMYGTDGVRAITEWAAGGPPTFDSTAAGDLLPVGQPIPPTPRRARLYLRDLISTITTTLPTVPYVRELNPTGLELIASGGANTVAEGATKPSANLSFQGDTAPITVVASTLTLSKQMFQDAPMVVQYINQRLPYLVKFTEDGEILNGSGTWPNMKGLLQYTAAGQLQTQNAISGEYAQTIGAAFAKVENVDAMVTAVVLNPTDAWAMFTKRAAAGAGTFDAGTPFSALPLTVWGVPTYRTRAKPAGSALVGDYQLGATIADREQVNTQVYNERYAEQNLVLLICEERLGLMVERPDVFVTTTLA